jgi:hypothetical protein
METSVESAPYNVSDTSKKQMSGGSAANPKCMHATQVGGYAHIPQAYRPCPRLAAISVLNPR